VVRSQGEREIISSLKQDRWMGKREGGIISTKTYDLKGSWNQNSYINDHVYA
jgi:hypothetical protein